MTNSSLVPRPAASVASWPRSTTSSAGRYVRRLVGEAPAWAVDRDEGAGLDELEARVGELERSWERFLSEPFDSERIYILDQGAYEAHAGVLIAQVLHHGSAHREQICAILTGFGFQPPDVQPWAYADATGRGGGRTADTSPR
jgi:uncharacterized damage-inducible protein DinB